MFHCGQNGPGTLQPSQILNHMERSSGNPDAMWIAHSLQAFVYTFPLYVLGNRKVHFRK